jgi:Predicted membrane protein
MAKCPHCETENAEGAMVCVACGKPMTEGGGADMGGESAEDSGSM